MNISEIYKELGEIDEFITKKLKRKNISEKKKEILVQKLKEHETLYLELKKNRIRIIKDYEYFDLLKENIKKTKEILIKIKYEIMYDLFSDSEETKERYNKTEENLNSLNEYLIVIVKKIKEKESNYLKKINELKFEINQKIDEYKYNNDIEDIQNKKEIYTRYMELQKNLFLNKNINFDLFENNDNLRYELNYRPYTEIDIKKIKSSGHIHLNNDENESVNESVDESVDEINDESIENYSPDELEEISPNLSETD